MEKFEYKNKYYVSIFLEYHYNIIFRVWSNCLTQNRPVAKGGKEGIFSITPRNFFKRDNKVLTLVMFILIL